MRLIFLPLFAADRCQEKTAPLSGSCSKQWICLNIFPFDPREAGADFRLHLGIDGSGMMGGQHFGGHIVGPGVGVQGALFFPGDPVPAVSHFGNKELALEVAGSVLVHQEVAGRTDGLDHVDGQGFLGYLLLPGGHGGQCR